MIRRFLLGLFLCGIATVTYGQEKEAKVTVAAGGKATLEVSLP